MTTSKPILILGGGINGAAIARELVLQGASVVLVDRGDLASGTIAYSSRLIHGGLRYLEYGEFSLVAESLRERAILLATAPQYVRPLRFFIPVRDRWSGLLSSALRFCRLGSRSSRGRGRYVVGLGLALYDILARRSSPPLPRSAVHRWPANDAELPDIRREGTRYLCSYSDAQVLYPERFTIALLRDAAQHAAQSGRQFTVLTYHEARLSGAEVMIEPLLPRWADNAAPSPFVPAAIINATGAWIDRTLARLQVPSARLIGGTKGSHLFTWNAALREALRGQAVYAEADDGRPAFVLPFGDGVLVGTTDIPCEDDPGETVATESELAYLISLVDSLFPQVRLERGDVLMHGCGVRPLPFVGPKTPAAVTRRHFLHWHHDAPLPFVSVIGGKLTTCRSLAEEAAQAVLLKLERPFQPGLTVARPLPAEPALPPPTPGSVTPENIGRFLENEWATTLADLVERRLMWLFDPRLTRASLRELAACLAACGHLDASEIEPAVQSCVERLAKHFGRTAI